MEETKKGVESKGKVVRICLDDQPFGRDEDYPKPGDKLVKSPLPQGISHGMLYRDVLNIALPSLFELALTQLTSMADQMMVGRLPGELGVQALSAVGLCGQPKMLLLAMIQALNVGATALVARYRGRGDRAKANQVLKQALLINVIIATICTVIGTVFAPQLINLVAGAGISQAARSYAVTYFRIQMYGFIPLCITFSCTAALRGCGDTKMPLFYNTLANIVNVFFNYCLIYGHFGFPAMDVAGASLATVMGQTTASVIAFSIILSKKRFVYLSFKEKLNLDKDIFHDVINIGLPSLIEQLFMRVGLIAYARIVSGLGDTNYATHQICMNIQSMCFMTGQAINNAATTLVGQSLGKKRADMADIYKRHAGTIGLITASIIALTLVFFGKNIVGLYNESEEIRTLGGSILLMVACMQPLQSQQYVATGALRGAGDTRFPAMVVFITVVLVRSGMGFVLVNVMNLGLWGAWYALVGDQMLRTMLLSIRYNTGKWRFIKLKGDAKPAK